MTEDYGDSDFLGATKLVGERAACRKQLFPVCSVSLGVGTGCKKNGVAEEQTLLNKVTGAQGAHRCLLNREPHPKHSFQRRTVHTALCPTLVWGCIGFVL